jgi:hypothetical protein
VTVQVFILFLEDDKKKIKFGGSIVFFSLAQFFSNWSRKKAQNIRGGGEN